MKILVPKSVNCGVYKVVEMTIRLKERKYLISVASKLSNKSTSIYNYRFCRDRENPVLSASEESHKYKRFQNDI